MPSLVARATVMSRGVVAVAGVMVSAAHTNTEPVLSDTLRVAGMDASAG